MNNLIGYTVGFIFDHDASHVLLIEKQKPDWQRGKLNGVGGRIEEGETSVACMVREAREECALDSTESDWRYFGKMITSKLFVDLYTMRYTGAHDDLRTTTREPVDWHLVTALPAHVLPNLRWLVPMADVALTRTDNFADMMIRYPGATSA